MIHPRLAGTMLLLLPFFVGCGSSSPLALERLPHHLEDGTAMERIHLKGDLSPAQLRDFSYQRRWYDDVPRILDLSHVTGLDKIESSTFYRTAFHTIILPEGIVELEAASFRENDSLARVHLPSTLHVIGDGAFQFCSQLQEVNLPEGLEAILHDAFAWCPRLGNVRLPETLRVLEGGAFAGCQSIDRIHIPAGLTAIQGAPFYACHGLQEFSVAEDNPSFASWEGSLYSKDYSRLVAFAGGIALGSLHPQTRTISPGALVQNETLVELELPELLESLPEGTFQRCLNLRRIVFRGRDTRLDEGVFSQCKNLESVVLPAGLESIPNSLFARCYSLKHVDLPPAITSIGASAFYGCAIERLDLPKTIVEIGVSAFASSKLREVVSLGSIEVVSDALFSHCDRLEKVVLHEGIRSLGERCFQRCWNLPELHLPASLTSIGKGAFDTGTFVGSLRKITVAEGNAKYASYDGCLYTKDFSTLIRVPSARIWVEIRTDIKEIAGGSFSDCVQLLQLELPDSVEVIGDYAFVSCMNLSSIYVPAGVRHIGNKAFSNCQLLSTILVAEDNPFYASWEECLYTKDFKTLLQVPGNRHELRVHPATTTITDWAASSGGLELVELPEGLETIGKAAFFGSSIKEIRIPSTVTLIEESVFSQCLLLERLEFADTRGWFAVSYIPGGEETPLSWSRDGRKNARLIEEPPRSISSWKKSPR